MPTLYVNGDSHSQYCYPTHTKLLTATELLATKFQLEYKNQALAGGSNQRIIRTTLEYLPNLDPGSTIIVIGWSSFERTEWYYQDKWHQICGQAAYNCRYRITRIVEPTHQLMAFKHQQRTIS